MAAIKLGPGVVGRLAPVAALVLGGEIFALWLLRDHWWAVFIGLGLLVVSAWWFMRSAFSYARDFPNHAVMEGGQMVAYVEATQGAKDPSIIDHGAPPTANTPPPTLIETDKDGDA